MQNAKAGHVELTSKPEIIWLNIVYAMSPFTFRVGLFVGFVILTKFPKGSPAPTDDYCSDPVWKTAQAFFTTWAVESY